MYVVQAWCWDEDRRAKDGFQQGRSGLHLHRVVQLLSLLTNVQWQQGSRGGRHVGDYFSVDLVVWWRKP